MYELSRILGRHVVVPRIHSAAIIFVIQGQTNVYLIDFLSLITSTYYVSFVSYKDYLIQQSLSPCFIYSHVEFLLSYNINEMDLEDNK